MCKLDLHFGLYGVTINPNMDIRNKICIKCSADYNAQLSGENWTMDYPKEHSSWYLCPSCVKKNIELYGMTLMMERIIIHSLGLDYQRIPFRNHYSAHVQSENYPVLQEMVKKGLMKESQQTVAYGYFRVTPEGKAAVGARSELSLIGN